MIEEDVAEEDEVINFTNYQVIKFLCDVINSIVLDFDLANRNNLILQATTVVVVGVEVMIATLLEETHQVTAATNAAKMVILHVNVPMLHKQVTRNVSNAEKLVIFHANVLKEVEINASNVAEKATKREIVQKNPK